ncbi:MAG: cytochrome c [Rubrivivax sp.]|nr:cytochrome c [Rubrivivax sp.]
MLATAGVALAALGGAVWWASSDHAAESNQERAALRPDDSRLTARGASIYAAQCASCHGANLQGQPNWRERGPDGLLPAPPHDASGHTWHHPDALLIRITRDGVAAVAGDPNYRTAMPIYRGLMSDEDIVAVLSWIKSRWPEDVRAKHDQINAQSR